MNVEVDKVGSNQSNGAKLFHFKPAGSNDHTNTGIKLSRIYGKEANEKTTQTNYL